MNIGLLSLLTNSSSNQQSGKSIKRRATSLKSNKTGWSKGRLPEVSNLATARDFQYNEDGTRGSEYTRLAPYCVRTRPSWRLTQRGTPHRQPRMGHSRSRGTARGQRRFRCLCRRKDRARTTCHRCQKCGRVHRQSHPRKLSKPRVPKTTSGEKAKKNNRCLPH